MPTIQPGRLQQLLTDMVNMYSPSGKEAQIVQFLSGYLMEHDLPVTLRPVTEGRWNIEVLFDPQPEVAFIGHVDTVPAFDIESYEAQAEDGIMHGLGTADMKGGCAAMIEAFISARDAGFTPAKAALFLVVGEEESGDGTSTLLESVRFPWAIVAEPTNLTPCLKHYGYIEMLIQASGRRRHAAMACREYNAILNLLHTLVRLAETMESDYPQAVLNIRSVHSSESGFAVPGSCEAWVDLHIPPSVALSSCAAQLHDLAAACLQKSSLTHSHVEFPLLAAGYDLPETGFLPEILKTVFTDLRLPWQHGAFRSHSDANLLREAGCAPIILGPGELARAHTREECVAVSQVVMAAHIYLGILEQLQA
ncbi:MAG: M20 family metallopeptidase [Kiritimatiellia bacterium]|nr:M20/M25/M40 family metallo-hydrolase [Lentisphaerota bacterium]